MLIVTPAIGNLIRENKTFRITSAIQTGQKQGMQLLDDHMFKLWQQGLVEKKEVMFRANNPEDLARESPRPNAEFSTTNRTNRFERGAGSTEQRHGAKKRVMGH